MAMCVGKVAVSSISLNWKVENAIEALEDYFES